jgi:hypothetical protein
MYRHGRFVYNHVEDLNCQWSRVERGQIDPAVSDEIAADTVIFDETKRGNKWVR